MRFWIITVLLLSTSACTSMLLGNASSGEGASAADTRSSAQVTLDNTITSKVRRRLSADDIVADYAIGVSTDNNVVTLTGTVGSFPARDRAVQIASEQDQVSRVTNSIVVNTNL